MVDSGEGHQLWNESLASFTWIGGAAGREEVTIAP
jgi:hypothetical protein